MTDEEIRKMWEPYKEDLDKPFEEVRWISADTVARYITRKVTEITGGNTYSESEELAVREVYGIINVMFDQIGL